MNRFDRAVFKVTKRIINKHFLFTYGKEREIEKNVRQRLKKIDLQKSEEIEAIIQDFDKRLTEEYEKEMDEYYNTFTDCFTI